MSYYEGTGFNNYYEVGKINIYYIITLYGSTVCIGFALGV